MTYPFPHRRFPPFAPLPRVRFPEEQPGQRLDYSINLGPIPLPSGGTLNDYLDRGDYIDHAELSVAPSGAGELQAAELAVIGSQVVFWGTEGVAGRDYVCRFELHTLAGRVFVLPALLPLSRVLATWPPVSPPSEGFSTPITWTYVPALDFTVPLNSGFLSLVAGF